MSTDSLQAPSGVTTRVLLAIIITVVAWASAFIVIRGVVPYFGGGELALGRLLVGTVLLALLLIGKKWIRPTAREWLLIILYGVAWFGAYNVTLNIAEHTLDAGTTSMIVNIGPILIALGAGIFLGEGVPKWLAIGAGVAFGGVVLIGFGTGLSGLGNGVGVLWALAAAVTYTVGVLCQKHVMRRIPSTQVTWMGCTIGTIACLPFAGGLLTQLPSAPVGAILGVLYLGAIPTSLAFSTWGYALSKLPAGQLGVTTYAVPAIVIVLGLIAFGEIPTIFAILGGIICLVGVALSRRRSPGSRIQLMDAPPPEVPV
ncbi:MAG: DMT family transporter, partial [Terrimesophilobacter sp.]